VEVLSCADVVGVEVLSCADVVGVEVLSCADVVGVEVLSCADVEAGSCEGRTLEVIFCANTELWLSSTVISMTVDSSSTAVSPPNLTCWRVINFYSKFAI
jgi:hypothetical protein